MREDGRRTEAQRRHNTWREQRHEENMADSITGARLQQRSPSVCDPGLPLGCRCWQHTLRFASVRLSACFCRASCPHSHVAARKNPSGRKRNKNQAGGLRGDI